jgi:hypothetical protein
LKKIHTFALKITKKKQSDLPMSSKAKVYYVEEHVKVLSEIIAQADPILGELSSEIHQFQKLNSRKISVKQRDTELFDRYGIEDFMTERDKLNISFRQMKDIEAIQLNKKFKISVRNNLGVRQ